MLSEEPEVEDSVGAQVLEQVPELQKTKLVQQDSELAHDEKRAIEGDWRRDSKNPYNWPTSKRIYHTIIPASFGFVVTFASSVYTPGVPEVAKQFHVSTTAALLPFSLFILGLGFGPILGAPLSEKRGRSGTYLISMPLFALFILGAGFSQNFASLIICRWFAGIFASPPLTVGAGTIADIWEPGPRAAMSTLYVLCPYLGPAMGPVIGGYVVVRKDWRWTQWTILFFAVAAYASAIRMKETYKKTILQHHAKSLGLDPPKGPSGVAALKLIFDITLIRPIHMLATEPIIAAISLYIAFNFAVLYSLFAAFPLVFSSIYGFGPEQTGLTFLALGVGCIGSVVTILLVDRFTYQRHHATSHREGRKGVVAPENRLYTAMMGSLGLPVGLFWFAWTARKEVHWMVPIAAAVPFGWGNLCVFVSGFLYVLDTYESLTAASAMAASSLTRYTLAAAFPLFIDQMYERLGVGGATSLLGGISVLLLPIPWVLFRWGPKIRAMSSYDTIAA